MSDTCGGCKHFCIHQRHPRDIVLDQPRAGECRVEPPKLIQPIVQAGQGPNGQPTPQLVGMLVSYLLLNDQFPACGKFEPAVEERDGFSIELGRG